MTVVKDTPSKGRLSCAENHQTFTNLVSRVALLTRQKFKITNTKETLPLAGGWDSGRQDQVSKTHEQFLVKGLESGPAAALSNFGPHAREQVHRPPHQLRRVLRLFRPCCFSVGPAIG